MNPMHQTGYPIDPETLTPDFLKKREKQAEMQKRYNDIISETQAVVNELADDRGLIVKEAVRLFAERIDQMIALDPECQAYERLFKSIALKLSAGEKIAKSKAFALLR